MINKEIIIASLIILFVSLILPRSIKLSKKNKEKRIQAVHNGNTRTIFLLRYIEGINTFITGAIVEMQFIADKLIIKELKSGSPLEIINSASLPYSRILDVDFMKVDRRGDVAIFSNIILESKTFLVIKYLSENGEEKCLIFNNSMPFGNVSLFVEVLKKRISHHKTPTHTNL